MWLRIVAEVLPICKTSFVPGDKFLYEKDTELFLLLAIASTCAFHDKEHPASFTHGKLISQTNTSADNSNSLVHILR